MKSVLVTGANGGMGRAVTALFADRGFRVYALDKDLPPAREGVAPLAADVTDEKSVAEAFAAVAAETDELCGIIHLAGIYLLDSLAEIEPASFEKIFRVNLGGAFLIDRAFLPLLKPGARIVLVTSELAAVDPLPFTGLYGITKTALDKYACSLGMELQLLGVSVSVLRAGAVDTGMLPASTRALEDFCGKTKLYRVSARRFRAVVDRVEARKVPPEKIADKLLRIFLAKKPRFAYSINKNPLLILLDLLPEGIRFAVIRRILKEKE